MKFLPIEENRRRLPTDRLQKELKKYIGDIEPYEPVLENIIKEWGYNLPGWQEMDGTIYYGFYEPLKDYTRTVLTLEYVDALAEEIIFINEEMMQNSGGNSIFIYV